MTQQTEDIEVVAQKYRELQDKSSRRESMGPGVEVDAEGVMGTSGRELEVKKVG